MGRRRLDNSQPQKFLSQLTAELHDMAQPLSIVHGALELAQLTPGTSIEQYQELAREVLEQVTRITESVRFMSQLTRFQQPGSDVIDVSLNAEVEAAIAEQRGAWDAGQVTVMYFRPQGERTIHISPSRLKQMLFHVLQLSRTLSPPGSVVHIKLQGSARKARLKIQHPPLGTRPEFNEDEVPDHKSTTRALALVDAIVTEAGGRLTVSRSPLAIVAELPRSPRS